MTLSDLKPGDVVGNRRSGARGKVVRLDKDEVTGAVLRVRVRPGLKRGAGFQWEATWWGASSIVLPKEEP